MVPTASLIFMALALALAVIVPVALSIILVRKYGCRWMPVLLGAVTFFIAVVVLESAVHKVALAGSFGDLVKSNKLALALYGGLMAGLFEELGRFGMMKWGMAKEASDVRGGLAYGVGHGGFEMLFLLASGMATNLFFATMINSGQSDALVAKVPAEAQAQVSAMIAQIQATKPTLFLVSIWERLTAVVLQLALSVLVWTAVRKAGKWLWLLPAAILLHALVDALAVILNAKAGILATEFVVMAIAVAVAGIAYMVWKKVWK